MRINVYAEEITMETQLVEKTPANHPGVTFYGARMFLQSPGVLHDGPDDDDRSAITLWVPWTKLRGHDFDAVRYVLRELLDVLDDAQAKTGGYVS